MEIRIKTASKNINLVLIMLLMCLLTSCAQKMVKKSGDGPPEFYVDETRVADAVPKKEPLAKYGNMRSYVVFGKRYYTMKSCRNYCETGTASWYGTKFHARKTSSGEPYDLCGMTAAHKTLPLPTYCEVTNLKTNKKIIVKVNDRGPFESNRIIDLSFVAAKKLGMVGHGTAKVRVRAIDLSAPNRPVIFAKKPTSPHHKQVFATGGKHVYLQVGAFHNRMRAEKLKHRLVAMLDAPVNVSKGKLYRVQVGPIRDMVTADRITHKLKGIGLSPSRK